MNTRLQQFLNLENLTSARFADIMNIQRSNVSHLLSGRNKPSWDFIQRFAVKFPNISTDWLLFGKGKPYREASATSTTPNSTNFSHSDHILSSSAPVTDDIFAPVSSEPVEFSIDGDDEIVDSGVLDTADAPKSTQNSPISRPKSVRRITLYYSDGTFEEFFPR